MQYKYGLKAGLLNTAEGTESHGEADLEAAYLRQLALQAADLRLRAELNTGLTVFLASWPYHEFADDALLNLSLLSAEAGRDAEAVVGFLELIYRYPGSEFADDAVREAVRLIEANRTAWAEANDQLYDVLVSGRAQRSLTDLEQERGVQADRWAALVSALSEMHVAELASLTVPQAQRFLVMNPEHTATPDLLAKTGELLLGNEDYTLGVGYLATVVVGYANSDVWPRAALKLGLVYSDVIGDSDRARIVLEALVQNAPDTSEASEAKRLIEEW